MAYENNSEVEKMEMYLILSGRWKKRAWQTNGRTWWECKSEDLLMSVDRAYEHEVYRIERMNR
jgi:hypothetical protein